MADFSLQGKKIWVAGASGMVGSAIVRRLAREECEIIAPVGSARPDLTSDVETARFLQEVRPDVAFIAAAKVGGITANNELRGEFIYKNLMIGANTIHNSYLAGVRKLVFLGSTCIYPRMAPQPMPESSLLTGPLEPTNEPYAIAKIAAIKLAQSYRAQYGCDFVSVMPTNLYGPGDNYDIEKGHVVAALIQKFHTAKVRDEAKVTVWGSGTPRREFMFVDDLADGCVFLAKNYSSGEIVNVGTGSDISISDFASLVAKVIGYDGEIVYDRSKPDGTPRKLTDVARINAMGWRAGTALETGLQRAYESFLAEQKVSARDCPGS